MSVAKEKQGSNIIIYIPMGWRISITFFNLNGTTSSQVISATDKEEVYEFIYGEGYSDIWFDATLLNGEEFNREDCLVTVTIETDRIGNIEKEIGDINTALDELHSYAQALIGGNA